MSTRLRRATTRDVKAIKKLLDYWATRGKVLARSLNEIYEQVRDFWVCQGPRGIVGCGALHVDWEDLGEVRSLVVARGHMRHGIGHRLLHVCLQDAHMLGVRRVMALTYTPEFFEKHGFRRIDKSELPHKIWHDCVRCTKFPDCDEVAVMLELGRGRRE